MSEHHDDDQYDLFVHGTVFFDVVFTGLESMPVRGTELQASGMGSCPGGIANLAIAASRLGVHTSLAAAFGDDVYGEDPTVNRLQEEAAAAVGKEAALFVPTGSMGNLLAVKCHTQPGNEVVIDRYAHIVSFEMGAMAWISG